MRGYQRFPSLRGPIDPLLYAPGASQPLATPADGPDSQSSTPVEQPIWIAPPVSWENVDLLAYALLPAIGSLVTILSFQIPLGHNGIINKVACNFVGGGWTEGTGDVIWRVLVDGTPPPGATSYDSIVASLGSPANPVGIAGFRVFENQVLTLVAFNNPAGANGGVVVSGQRVGARLLGYLYQRELEDPDAWI